MKRLFACALAILAILILGGCGAKGDPALAPVGGITVVPGDGYVTVSWEMSPGVDYWVYQATTDGAPFDPNTCATVTGCLSRMNAVSPYIVPSLVNGVNYSFLITGRTNGGPGGSPTPVVSAVPRIAGSSWIPNTSTDTNTLRSVVLGGAIFVAVSDNGGIYTSTVNPSAWTTWNTWTKQSTPVLPATNLYAVIYSGIYLAAGANGTVLTSSDAVTWAAQNSGTSSDLNALTTNGGGRYVAVGAGGTIIYSDGGAAWVQANSQTANALYGVTYGGGQFVAVGAQGTVLTSTDGATWVSKPVGANPLLDLKSVAFGGSVNIFVAVGAAGTLVTSTDLGVTWTSQAPIPTGPALNAVTSGKQFVAVGDGGAIYTSLDAVTWTAQAATPAISDNLYSVGVFTNSYLGVGYAAVGAAGRNLSAN